MRWSVASVLLLVALLVAPTAAAQSDASALTLPGWLYWTMPFLASTVLLAIGLLVLLRGQPVIYNRVFFLLCLASSSKGYTESVLFFMLQHGSRGSVFEFVAILNRLIAYVYAPIFLWFVLVFPRPVRPWLKNGARGAWVLLLALPFAANHFLHFAADLTMQNAFNVYVSVLALAALGLLVYHAWETDSEEEKVRLRLLSVTFFLIVFSTIMVALLELAGARAQDQSNADVAATYSHLSDAFGTVASPILELVGYVLLMYGILRYQLLGVEMLVKRLTRGSLFAVSMSVIFVIVSNSVEQIFQVKILNGIRFDYIIAGFITVILLYPVQKGAEKIANRLFPQAGSAEPDYLSKRRMEIYEAQLRYALLDGQLKDKELQMLHALQESLQLTSGELQKVASLFPGLDPAPLVRRGARPMRG